MRTKLQVLWQWGLQQFLLLNDVTSQLSVEGNQLANGDLSLFTEVIALECIPMSPARVMSHELIPLHRSDAVPIVFVVDNDFSVRESLEPLIRRGGWESEIFASANGRKFELTLRRG